MKVLEPEDEQQVEEAQAGDDEHERVGPVWRGRVDRLLEDAHLAVGIEEDEGSAAQLRGEEGSGGGGGRRTSSVRMTGHRLPSTLAPMRLTSTLKHR